MKYLLVFVQLVIASTLIAQSSTRTIVPGMKCSMEIEEGFQLATRFSGFENTSLNANILVSNLSSPVEKNLASVESDQMKVRGFHFVSKRDVKLKNGPATLFILNHESKNVLFRKYFLIFGDSAKTIFIDAMAPDSNQVLCNSVEKIILSTVYDANMMEDPFAALEFTMSIDTSLFKVAKNSVKSIVFTNKEGMNPAFLSFSVAVQSLGVKTEERNIFAETKLKGLNGTDSILSSSINAVAINGLTGYVMQSSTINKFKKPSYNYQVFLFGKNDDYYLMIGRSFHSLETSKKTFEPIAKSFQLK